MVAIVYLYIYIKKLNRPDFFPPDSDHIGLGDTNIVTSTFSDPVVYTDSRDLLSTFCWSWETDNMFGYRRGLDLDPYRLPHSMTRFQKHSLLLAVSERYFFAFLIQAMIFMTMCSDTSLPLRAPSLPYINPAASFPYNKPSKPQRNASSFSFPTSPPLPWLQNRPAGTPLSELLSSADSEGNVGDGHCHRRLWAGYYVRHDDTTDFTDHDPVIDPPMFLELYTIKGPIDPLPFPSLEPDPSERINLQGEGHDSIGRFTLQGYCNMRTGAVTATKAYATHEWPWRGEVTPFGMAGLWGLGAECGWWWIWPREWSATTGPD